MITITEIAATKVKELIKEEGKKLDKVSLRVFVQGGGCSGFQYGIMLDDGETGSDTTTDQTFELYGLKIVVDPISIQYLNGAEVDFVDNPTGGGFTVKNPNAKSTCGCGSSFSTE